jgi:hypothetical protein
MGLSLINMLVLFSSVYFALTVNTASNNTLVVVCLPIRYLETGSCIVARVRFLGTVFIEPLSNNELFRPSGVMSRYIVKVKRSISRFDWFVRFEPPPNTHTKEERGI